MRILKKKLGAVRYILGPVGNMFTIYDPFFKFSRTQFLQKGKLLAVLLEIFHFCTYLQKSPTDLLAADLGSSGWRIMSIS